MIPTISPDELSQLGLSSVAVGDSDPLPSPTPTVSQGLSAAVDVSFTAVTRGGIDIDFMGVDVPAARSVGLELARAELNPSILKVTSHGPSFRVAGRNPIAIWEEDETTALFDLDRLVEPFGAIFGDDTGIVLRPFAGDFYVIPVFGHPVEVTPQPAVTSDVERWLEDQDDAWLVGQCRGHLSLGGAYHHLVAVGMLARFKRPEDVVGAVGRILRGQYDPIADRERAWARLLGPKQVAATETVAISEVILLEQHLEQLLENVDSADPFWQRAVLEALHRRDDLEGVRVLLRAAQADNALETALSSLDAFGLRFIVAVPPVRDVEQSVRLRNVASINPEAWWVRPLIRSR